MPHMASTEQTYIMVKPDGKARGLVAQNIRHFERKDLTPSGGLGGSQDMNSLFEDIDFYTSRMRLLDQQIEMLLQKPPGQAACAELKGHVESLEQQVSKIHARIQAQQSAASWTLVEDTP